MRTAGNLRVPVGVAAATGLVFLASCATTSRPQQFRTFFLPPQAHPPVTNSDDAVPDPPRLRSDRYSNEVPEITTVFPDALPRPSDADFILKKADDRLAAGRQAYQNGQIAEARRE